MAAAQPASLSPHGLDGPTLDAVLRFMRQHARADFSGYRRGTIERRIRNRMVAAGLDCPHAYLARLAGDPAEPQRLLQCLTIKVSRFYRNPHIFDALATEVLPALRDRAAGRPLRLWSAGCACGEEAYSLAMLLEDAGLAGSVLGTDIDPAALATAQPGVYGPAALAELPPHLRERHLEPLPGHGSLMVSWAVRRRVRFMRHDLTTGLPAGSAQFDLVSCRNVLIYFGPGVQRQVFDVLLQATREQGFICLGEAEWPLPEVADRLRPLGDSIQLFQRTNAGETAACVMPA